MNVKPVKPRTKMLRSLDRRHVWHPFTQMADWTEEDIVVIEKGKGHYLIDTDGNRYLDGISSLWCNLHGHRVRKINAAIRRQLGLIAHSTLLGLASPPSIKLAAQLASVAPPGLTKVFFSDNGATAVEAALKIALQFHLQTGQPAKTLFAALTGAYHGDTIGAISVGGIDHFHSIFSPLRFDVVRIPAPYCYRCPEGLERTECDLRCAKRGAAIITEHAHRLAALIIEPIVQGAAGIIVQPRGYLSTLRKACAENNVLFIADEVATGFGRTGTMFACEHEGIVPDLLCVAKGLSGGYLPLAATLATQQIFDAFLGTHESMRAFYHGHTYTGNALACAAALESLRLLRRSVLPSLPRKIEILSGLLGRLITPLPHVGEVRQAGLMVGIELVRDTATQEPYAACERIGHRAILEARKRGVVLRPLGNVVVLMPPLTITEAELKTLVEVAAASIAAATGGK